jgi:hypothetical protein
MTMIEAGWDVRSRITSDAMERQDEHRVAGKSISRRDCMNPVIGLNIANLLRLEDGNELSITVISEPAIIRKMPLSSIRERMNACIG